jgi:hypothetical protein
MDWIQKFFQEQHLYGIPERVMDDIIGEFLWFRFGAFDRGNTVKKYYPTLEAFLEDVRNYSFMTRVLREQIASTEFLYRTREWILEQLFQQSELCFHPDTKFCVYKSCVAHLPLDCKQTGTAGGFVEFHASVMIRGLTGHCFCGTMGSESVDLILETDRFLETNRYTFPFFSTVHLALGLLFSQFWFHRDSVASYNTVRDCFKEFHHFDDNILKYILYDYIVSPPP